MSVEPAAASDLDAIKALLHVAHLPTDDLTEGVLATFLVARKAGTVIGVIGIELYGAVALLRSLVTEENARGRGLGASLVDAAEALARSRSVQAVYLLTTTADEFFAARGYRRIDRGEAPAEIRATTQFSALCPASAVLMVKP